MEVYKDETAIHSKVQDISIQDEQHKVLIVSDHKHILGEQDNNMSASREGLLSEPEQNIASNIPKEIFIQEDGAQKPILAEFDDMKSDGIDINKQVQYATTDLSNLGQAQPMSPGNDTTISKEMVSQAQ